MEENFEYIINGTLPEEYSESNLVENDIDLDKEDDINETELEDDSDDEEDLRYVHKCEFRDEDWRENDTINKFLEQKCGCQLNDGLPCSDRFDFTQLVNYRADILQLSKTELDLVLLTCIRNALDNSAYNSKGEPRKNHHMHYQFKGQRICEKTFRIIYAVGKWKLSALVKYYKLNETLVARTHGNSQRRPWNALTFEDTVNLRNFLINYSSQHATSLPGRYPGFRNFRIKLLESHVTKKKIHEIYVQSCKDDNKRYVEYVLFNDLWTKLLPYIVIAKPRNDLCTDCQQNNFLIIRSANEDEGKKREKLAKQEEHLYRSERERLFYRQQCKRAKEEVVKSKKENRAPLFTHISFDFAQQLMFPAPPDQPGGLFFLTPRKCGLFGICAEAIFQQVNYLIDECVMIGKDANTIISFLDHYLTKYIKWIPVLNIHADNCVGQNKNRFVIMYLMWRVITQRNNKIHLGFMVAGHTKFACDACFGLLKKVTKKTFISSVTDIAECVVTSTEKSMTNLAELVGLENGKLLVQYYDWKTYLESFFVTIPNITKYHHFDFSAEYPRGEIHVQEFQDSDSEVYNMMVDNTILPKGMPDPIYPVGMTQDRKEYLYKEIRKFCRPGTEDLVAPKPEEKL